MDLHHYRENYAKDELIETNLPSNPMYLFGTWMDAAIASEITEPNAMALATSTLDGLPSVRIVLLKHFNAAGFTFYTNYNSRKGQEINQNPNASFTMWWPPLQRQVRVEGSINRISEAASADYFNSRPEGSRRGAIVSPQSQTIASRDFLENQLNDLIENGDLNKPVHWGGYTLVPSRIEFWQGRESRLHDRIVYDREGENWVVSRLAP